MSLGLFYSSRPSLIEDQVSSFFFNKSLQQRGAEYRAADYTDDIRQDLRLVGTAIVASQERALRRYEKHEARRRTSMEGERRAAALASLREAEAHDTLRRTLVETVETARRAITDTTLAVDALHAGLARQLSGIEWLVADTNAAVHGILRVLRDSRSNECRQLLEQAERNLAAGYLPEAEDRLRKALTYDNTDYGVHQQLGLVSVRRGRLDVALRHFQKALAFPPSRCRPSEASFFIARAATHAARACYARGRYADAERYFQQALDVEPTSAKNWFDLAVVRTGQGLDPLDALTHAIELDPLLAGAALADDELAPARDAMEDLVVRMTHAAFEDLDRTASEFVQVATRAADHAQVFGFPPPQPVHPAAIIDAARTRGTYLAAREALTTVRAALTQLRYAIRRELLVARARIESNARAAIGAHERARRVRADEVRGTVEELEGQYRRLDPGVFVVTGSVLGAVALLLLAHTFAGLVVGVVLGALAAIIWNAAARASIGREIDAATALREELAQPSREEQRQAESLERTRAELEAAIAEFA